MLIDRELCAGQVVLPVIMQVINIAPEVLFQGRVKLVGLSVCVVVVVSWLKKNI